MKRILGITIVALCLWCLLFVGVTPRDSRAASPTMAYSQTDEWAEVSQNAVREGATTTISDCYTTKVFIDYALTSATAHTGTKIEVQVSSNTSGDEDWTTYTSFITLTGTPNTEALSGSEAAAQTVLEVASTTGLYDDDETRWIFIEDNTVADSEMCYLVSHVAATSVTVLDGITNAHTSADILNDIADRVPITLPTGYNRMRVIYDNTYDSDGATIHTHCAIVETTALPG